MKESRKINIFGLPINCLNLQETAKEIIFRAKNKKGGVFYCCTLNEVAMAGEDSKFKKILLKGDVLTPDGMPLVWGLRLKGFKKATRVYGPELLEHFINKNIDDNVDNKIRQLFIGDEKNKEYFGKIGIYLVLPYKDVFVKNDYQMIVEKIKNSKARVVWLGLGAKKQIVMANSLYKMLPDRVYITVGAAFDFISKNKKQAPKWLRNLGGEWLFRCIQEPGRLAKRYKNIVSFMVRRAIRSLFA